MELIIFISVWLILIVFIIFIAVSNRMTKREIELYEQELRKPSRLEADKFVDDFKTRIAICDGIEKELKKRHIKRKQSIRTE